MSKPTSYAIRAKRFGWRTPPAPPPPVSEGLVEIDKYSTTFVRARATTVDLSDGNDHWFTFALATTPGPGGGEVIASTAALFQLGGVVWFDNGGQLGHVKDTTGSDFPSTAAANFINVNRLASGHLDLTDPAHPNLVLVEVLG